MGEEVGARLAVRFFSFFFFCPLFSRSEQGEGREAVGERLVSGGGPGMMEDVEGEQQTGLSNGEGKFHFFKIINFLFYFV